MHRLLILVLFVGLTSIHLCGQISHDPTKIKGYKVISDILQDAIQSALENKYDSAHNKMNLAYNIAQDKSYIELVPIILMAQSRLYVSEQDYPRASEKIKLAEPFFKDDTITSIAGDFYDFQAQSYLHLNKLSEALAAIQKCEKIRLHIEPGKNWRTYIGMGRIYNKMGNTKTAEIYFQKSEKLSKIQTSKKILSDLQNELKFEEKDGTISVLSSENKKSKGDLIRAKFKNQLMSFGLIALAVLSILLYIIIKQRSKLNKEVTLKNQLITKNLEEKEYLIKEIHHRVKNNLQVISSLLSLQSRTVEDQSAVDALNESQSRVLSMSLIHQNLYKDGPSSHLSVKDYISNLTQSLFHTYNINTGKISLEMEIDDCSLDVATLVPLGLIINELITNSLKYAFPNQKAGIIGVEFKQNEGSMSLSVWDNGIGITPLQSTDGFGHRLIHTFAKRLNAGITFTKEKGTRVTLVMKDFKTII